MQLHENDLGEFATLWQKAFGETLTVDEARHHASRLMRLYAVLAQSAYPATAEYHLDENDIQAS